MRRAWRAGLEVVVDAGRHFGRHRCESLGAALQTAIQNKTVDWAAFETAMQTKWKAEK